VFNILLFNILLFNILLYDILLYDILLYIQHFVIWHFVIQHFVIWHFVIQHFVIWHFVIQHFVIWHFVIQHFVVQHFVVRHFGLGQKKSALFRRCFKRIALLQLMKNSSDYKTFIRSSVTGLADFSPLGRLFTLSILFLISEVCNPNFYATEKSEAIACARRCRSSRLAGGWTLKNNWKNGGPRRRRGTRGCWPP
jgi:hypothetical protein